jgi:hypothetical protein
MLNPKPANDTRWNARNIETCRALEIMDDVQETNKTLLAEDGDDYNLLSEEEKQSGDIERFTYTDDNIMTLRQWEAASDGAKYFSKFTQENGNTISYMLLEVQIALDNCRTEWFQMAAGKSCFCNDYQIDLTILKQSFRCVRLQREIKHRRSTQPKESKCVGCQGRL